MLTNVWGHILVNKPVLTMWGVTRATVKSVTSCMTTIHAEVSKYVILLSPLITATILLSFRCG